MNSKKVVQILLLFFITITISAQKTAIYTNHLKEYNHAVELYQNKAYAASLQQFEEIKPNFKRAFS